MENPESGCEGVSYGSLYISRLAAFRPHLSIRRAPSVLLPRRGSQAGAAARSCRSPKLSAKFRVQSQLIYRAHYCQERGRVTATATPRAACFTRRH